MTIRDEDEPRFQLAPKHIDLRLTPEEFLHLHTILADIVNGNGVTFIRGHEEGIKAVHEKMTAINERLIFAAKL